jgi:endonuclease/exonuclease/phosphatase family metal-dependent hydrolase
MTYNIRYDNPNDGENNWHNRKETLVNQILFYKPDIIGTQEGLEHQIHYINDYLSSYKYVGIARADVKEGGKGEFSAIFYNTDKYTVLINETFWLSKTPEKPSRGWDASLNRICTYVLLKSNSSGERFWIFNTHFDHMGKKAREKSAELILENINSINKENLPLFLMGDFNLIPGEFSIQLIMEQLNDSREISQQSPFGPEGTYNGFDVCKRPEKRIDYIFVSKNKITVKKYGVLANVKDQKYPSDHFPVFIIAEVK